MKFFFAIVVINSNMPRFEGFEGSSFIMDYLTAVHWAVSTMTSASAGDILPRSLQGYFIGMCVRIGGLLLFAYILSRVVAIFVNNGKSR